MIRLLISAVLVVQTLRDRFPSYSLTEEDRAPSSDYMHSAFLVSRYFEIPYLLWLLYSEINNSRSSLSVIHIIGSVVYLLGDVIRLRAKSELGRFFTYDIGIREGHRLVTTGPYRYLIHPSYLGYALKTIGLVLYFKSPYLFAINLFLGIFIFSRIYTEEEMLLKEFGEEFVEYRNSRWRMVPFIF